MDCGSSALISPLVNQVLNFLPLPHREVAAWFPLVGASPGNECLICLPSRPCDLHLIEADPFLWPERHPGAT